ncbi:MAG TPA: hypothetical protein VIM53_01740 [Candidatus Saccharimonadales bacterium]
MTQAPEVTLLPIIDSPPIKSSEARLRALEDMALDIALRCIEHVEDVTHAREEEIFLLGRPPEIPAHFEQELTVLETDFAEELVDTGLQLVERAVAHANATGAARPKRLVIRTDLDGSQVPFTERDKLRPGFIPSVHFLREVLANEYDMDVRVGTHSDRKTKAQDEEVPHLMRELDEIGILESERIVSTCDGETARQLDPVLVTQRRVYGPEVDPQIVFERQRKAVEHILVIDTPDDALKLYHEKGAIIDIETFGPGADEAEVTVVVDDFNYAGNIVDNHRVAGVQTKYGELQPISYRD